MVYAMVNSRFYWSVPSHDAHPTIVHLEAEDTTTGKNSFTAQGGPK